MMHTFLSFSRLYRVFTKYSVYTTILSIEIFICLNNTILKLLLFIYILNCINLENRQVLFKSLCIELWLPFLNGVI